MLPEVSILIKHFHHRFFILGVILAFYSVFSLHSNIFRIWPFLHLKIASSETVELINLSFLSLLTLIIFSAHLSRSKGLPSMIVTLLTLTPFSISAGLSLILIFLTNLRNLRLKVLVFGAAHFRSSLCLTVQPSDSVNV